mmetsp:Transcript_4231/g.5885  ORF Transcript_4231/g.5885 Transcript_4231/m.5885 type:complete len:203 (-) Transcript_4231:400-1008(-)
MVHFYRLNFCNNSRWGKHGMNTRFDDTSLNTSYWNSSDTSNLVDILKGKTECLISWTLGWVHVVKCLKKVWSLVPAHVGGFVNHVISLPSRNGNKWNLDGLVSNLFEVSTDLRLDLIVTAFVILNGLVVHLVTGNNHLLDSKSEGKKGVLTCLSILGDTSLETTLRRVDNKNGNICLRCSGNHVFNEITMSWGINHGERVLW